MVSNAFSKVQRDHFIDPMTLISIQIGNKTRLGMRIMWYTAVTSKILRCSVVGRRNHVYCYSSIFEWHMNILYLSLFLKV